MAIFSRRFQYNILLRYGMMPQDIPATCDGCSNKLQIEHALSFPKFGLLLARHDGAANDLGDLLSWALTPSNISF